MQRNGGGGMFDEISGQISLPGIFSNLAERMVSAALSRQRTRTSSAESERSRETARNWNLSQGQQQAMPAQWVQRGNRNL